MNRTRLALVTAVALLCSHVLVAQASTSAGLIRHVAAGSSFALVVAIDAGSGAAHGVSGAIRDDGTLWLWGSNASAMFGNGAGPLSPDDPGGRNLLPAPVKGIAGAKSLSIGEGHVAVLLGDGTLRMWGHDGWGQIGVGTSGFYHEKPMKVTTLANVTAVYLGGAHSFAVRADGTFWIWGFGYQGRGLLGKDLHVPTRLDLP